MSEMRSVEAPRIALPHNLEAEQALLGAILVNNKAFETVSDFLEAEHFAEGVNGRIYRAIETLLNRGEAVSPITLKRYFDQDKALEEIGGAQYLVRLAAAVVTIVNAKDYGRQIRDCWVRRELIAASLEAIENAERANLDSTGEDVLEATEARLYKLGERQSSQGLIELGTAARHHLARVEKAYQAGGTMLGVSTGLNDLDNLMGGLQAGDLIVCGARPGMGKSLLAGVIARNVARRRQDGEGIPAIFSLEQSTRLWVARWLASETGIATNLQFRGKLDQLQFANLVAAEEDLRRLQIEIDDTAGLSVAQIRQRARRVARKKGLSLIVVDHINLMSATSRMEERGNDTAKVTEITKGLKALAKDLGVPVFALCQLNRGVEARDDKRPTLADLRQSGSIEQDADVVMFLYRHAYYLERNQPHQKEGETFEKFQVREADWHAALSRCRNILEIDVAKARGGPIDKIEVYYDGAAGAIHDRAKF